MFRFGNIDDDGIHLELSRRTAGCSLRHGNGLDRRAEKLGAIVRDVVLPSDCLRQASKIVQDGTGWKLAIEDTGGRSVFRRSQALFLGRSAVERCALRTI